MKLVVKFFVFFLILLLCFDLTFSYCYQPDIDGCFAEGSACTSDLNCISKLCVNSVCQPNHSQVMVIDRILEKDALFERIELTAKNELKLLLFYNEFVSNSLYQKVSLMKKSGANWVNTELYSTNQSNRYLLDVASGYFDDGTKVYFNVAGFDTSGSSRNYFEIFGGEGISNTIEFLSHKPNYSSTYYQNDGIFTERYRINSSNKSIYVDCVNTDHTDYHNQLLYGNPTNWGFPSVVYNFTDYSSSMTSYSCTQGPVFVDKVNSKIAITIHDNPVNAHNAICPYKYCEGSAFPYSCVCLNEYGLYHTPLVKINSNNESVLFSFSQNKLKECTQTVSGFNCNEYVLEGSNFNPAHEISGTTYPTLDVEIINDISYVVAVVDYSKILLCNKNPLTDSFDCNIVVDLNYIRDSSDSISEGKGLISYVSIEPHDGNLVLAYVVQTRQNLFKEDGIYLSYSRLFEYPPEEFCGNGVVDEGENCKNCPEDVVCQEGYSCNDEGECIKDVPICAKINESCGSQVSCCSGLVCGTENKCVKENSCINDGFCNPNCPIGSDPDCSCMGIDEGCENNSDCCRGLVCGEGNVCVRSEGEESSCVRDGVCNHNCPEGVDPDCVCVGVDGSCVDNSDCCRGLVCGAENKCVSTSSASASIDVFNLFVDGNKLYYKIKCNKEVPIDINLYKGEVSSKNLVSVDDVCEVEEKNGLILDSVEEKIIYTAIAKIQPICKVCTKTDYLVVEDLVNPTNVPDNSIIFVLITLIGVIFLLNKTNKK